MFQLKKFLHPLFVATVLLCSCGQTEEVTVDDSKKGYTPEDSKVVFRLQSNSSTATRSAEDSYNHVQGTADEYKVNSARVYFFDNMTKLLAKSVQLSGITFFGTDGSGNIIYETEPISIPHGTYDIFVTANTNRQIKTDQEDKFLADIDSITYTKALIEDISGGIVMANRASDNIATTISKSSDNDVNVINIALERVLARLDVAKAAESFELTDNNGTKYASIKLDGYFIVNVPKYFYTYRHTAVLTSMNEPDWNLMTHFGNVSDVNGYVIDPYFFKKSIDASNFTNADKYYENYAGGYSNPNQIPWNSFNAVSQTPNYKTAYCLENCSLRPAQENGYSTGVLFKAIMEPQNNVYHLGSSGNLELITDKNLYPEVLYFFQRKFYDSAEALAAAVSATGSPSNKYQARKFEKTDDGYRCYYKYWVRHLDNNKPTEMGVMEFAIVRNNLYRMLITGVSDLGDEGPEIIPDTPDEGDTYLKVVLNVKPWIVRDLTDIVL
jgi:hypothetical protein